MRPYDVVVVDRLAALPEDAQARPSPLLRVCAVQLRVLGRQELLDTILQSDDVAPEADDNLIPAHFP